MIKIFLVTGKPHTEYIEWAKKLLQFSWLFSVSKIKMQISQGKEDMNGRCGG